MTAKITLQINRMKQNTQQQKQLFFVCRGKEGNTKKYKLSHLMSKHVTATNFIAQKYTEASGLPKHTTVSHSTF